MQRLRLCHDLPSLMIEGSDLTGVQALLAREGMTGPAPIFEGQMGFEKQLGVSLGNVGDLFVKRPNASNVNEGTAAMILIRIRSRRRRIPASNRRAAPR